ncbi:DNA repair protein [Marinobacter sp. Arc7-DN-1]|uniref:DNA repair protein n=1 Tax=Marinobacter sp. Arc7-DN-1 TaxID=2304594 RepID=UPI000E444656|nr:DNA repair protein [Marinobacter sp. Arc7-DN-1]AXS84879.1 DNA repair protein [Marinobacter sp. Arc7-DN-1]
MESAGQAAEGYSAVFFMEGSQVAREMRASEFGAFLDGYVGLSDLAETEVRAVLVELSDDLLVQALVFFRIWFDEEGRADSHWNVPIEALAGRGAKGPDMGGGAIRLVCRSQCPDPQYKEDLWDPDMTPGNNHFQAIRKAVEVNNLKFRKIEPVQEENIPVLSAQAEDSADPEESAAAANRSRLAQLIREQRLRIKTLQSVHRDSLSDIQREHRLEMQGLRSEMANLEQKYERQRLSNEQLKKRLSERNEQYLTMQEQMVFSGEGKQQDDASVDAELVLLREQLERRQRELELRNDMIVALEQEIHELRHREPAENSILDHLKRQSVFLVAYQPGVGHVTLPFKDIETYFNNPTAYAAERCGMNEPAYREWLEHYENPVCKHEGKGGKFCEEPILRISQPAEFRPGIDDRCEKHRD